jgi:dTDP-4-dehydrorhamnose 3,5-epimerase-like enzyme
MLSKVRQITLPKIPDDRGNLSFIEQHNHIPFKIQRTYWIYDVPGGEVRGGHAFKMQEELIIALAGSFDLVLNNGKKIKKIHLNRSYTGIYVPQGLWRHMENFSTNSVVLILTSTAFNEADYIRDFNEYIEYISNGYNQKL